jgi:acetyltransferase-like isoleucine patch superfamily enzyme
VSTSATALTRRAGNAALAGAARAHALLAYLTGGMEGVNRVVRHTSKPGVIPVLRMFGARIGEACDFEAPLVIHNAHRRYTNLAVGARCHLGKDVFLDLAAPVTLADRVTVSMRAMILTHTDAGQSPLASGPLPASRAAVTFGTGAYIGAGAIVLAGVAIGECAVVGAGAVVTGAVPPRVVVAGSPARVLREIPREASPS